MRHEFEACKRPHTFQPSQELHQVAPDQVVEEGQRARHKLRAAGAPTARERPAAVLRMHAYEHGVRYQYRKFACRLGWARSFIASSSGTSRSS